MESGCVVLICVKDGADFASTDRTAGREPIRDAGTTRETEPVGSQELGRGDTALLSRPRPSLAICSLEQVAIPGADYACSPEKGTSAGTRAGPIPRSVVAFSPTTQATREEGDWTTEQISGTGRTRTDYLLRDRSKMHNTRKCLKMPKL